MMSKKSRKNNGQRGELERVLLFTRFTWLSARSGIKCNLKILKHFATSWQMKARPIMSTAKFREDPRNPGTTGNDTNNRKE